jgi:uncharacterized membrane protein YjgN (DUF898 family)
MGAQAYMLVFAGELAEGFELEQAKQNLRELFSISQEKIEELFSFPRVVLKRNLDHDSAQVFQTQLHKQGLVTEIVSMEESATPPVAEKQEGTTGAVSVADGEPIQFEFLGKAGEYFKIWIVNVLLSIVTLGIYSAWAKVRNHRYFYSNTQLSGHSFEYTANPVNILKGRIIAALFFAGYVFSTEFMPVLTLIFVVLFVVGFPWLACKSLAFRNRNTVFRNIRFGFDGTYFEALKAFILWPFLGAISFGLLFPYAIFRQKAFIVGYARYGTSPFQPKFTAGGFYNIYLIALGVMILVGIVAGVVGAVIPSLVPVLFLPVYLFLFAYVNAKTANLIYNQTLLEEHGFDSRIMVGRLAWIYLSNAVAVALTIGLAMPWAKVRLAAYHASCLRLQSRGSLDEFVAAQEKNVSALGEEIGDVFDLDIGL